LLRKWRSACGAGLLIFKGKFSHGFGTLYYISIIFENLAPMM
jgi:hypothetical protein